MEKITISKGNRKMGSIPSVSLPPCTTCNPSAPCFKKCYALKIARLYKNVKNSYENNLQVLNASAVSYWLQVKASAMVSRFFRYHVSGDIPNAEYFAQMIQLANELPNTKFLAFTKQYIIVNEYLDKGEKIPSNLKVILSNWGEWKCSNPYSLPVCEIIFNGETPCDDWKVCGGNCTECACRGVGCWEIKDGETLAIYEH